MSKIEEMNKRGFTLIELLIVISIIGILAAIAITSYIGVTKKAARSEANSNLGSIRLLEEQFFAENACYQPLVAGACPAGSAVYAGTVAIQAFLPGFRPGPGLSYTYQITTNMQLTGGGGNTVATPPTTAASAPPCFVATATGIPGTRVCSNAANCDMFAIDCNNLRNF
jgi:prepilin-type N-terminal cleavage/methylation domain-containing protein